MLVLSGILSLSIRATKWRTVLTRLAMDSTSGKNVMSKNSTWFSAWSAMKVTWSACRRGLMVLSTRPEPDTA